jgi:hypothetical protein
MQLTEHTRLATLDDMPELLKIAREFFLASPFSDFPFNEAKVRKLLEFAIIDHKRAVVIVATDENDTPQGIIAGRADEAPFSDAVAAIEMAWYLRPAYRKAKRAFDMLAGFEAWSRAIGASYIYYGLLRPVLPNEVAEKDNEALDRLYKHQGARPVEAGYIKKLD